MALLTAADVRAHVETSLDDVALQRIIDRLDTDMILRAGPHSGPLTEVLPGATPSVYLGRPVASLTSVREGERIQLSTPALDLSLDLTLWADEGRIERRPAAARFAPVVEVVYDPVDDLDRRKRTLLELVRLDLAQSGRSRERIGEYRYSGLDYETHREALLRELRPFLTLE